MPLFDTICEPEVQVFVWETGESEIELYRLLPHTVHAAYREYCSRFHTESRRKEWLAVRVLLHRFVGAEARIVYSSTGRPYLQGDDREISISHTDRYAALALGRQPVGIDLEADRKHRIDHVSHRVFGIRDGYPDDGTVSSPETYTERLLRWSAKESLYKLFDYIGADFRTRLIVQPFKASLPQGVFPSVVIDVSGNEHALSVAYKRYTDFVLTWVVRRVPSCR